MLTVPDAQAPPDHSNPAAMHDNAPFAGNLFWQAPEDHGLPDVGVKQPIDEDMTPLDVDDAALNACVDPLLV